MSRAAILIEGVSKRFRIGARVKQADTLGETLALIGCISFNAAANPR